MDIKLIETADDYKEALARADAIFDARKGTKEGEELEALAIMIEEYESHHFPMTAPDPIEAIKFRVEQLNIDQEG